MIAPRQVYEQLWQEAAAAFDRGQPRLDPLLPNRRHDQRRGITLIIRPEVEVRRKVGSFLQEVATAAPGQHYYRPEEFHVTVVSVIPGSEHWQKDAERLPEYQAVLDGVLRQRPVFSVSFRGVTASAEAVMIQGFPAGDSLARLRDDLRAALLNRGLGDNLDRRYKIVAAHLTIARFIRPLPDWQPLKALLAANRDRDFGMTQARSLQLIESNWYASADTVRLLRDYPLA